MILLKIKRTSTFYAGFIFIMYINTLYIMKIVKTLSFFKG